MTDRGRCVSHDLRQASAQPAAHTIARSSSSHLGGRTMNRLGTAMLVVGMVISVLPQAHGQVITYNFTMSGPNESPPNASPGTGSGNANYNPAVHTLAISANFTGLTGTTTASHIHAPTATPGSGTAGVA